MFSYQKWPWRHCPLSERVFITGSRRWWRRRAWRRRRRHNARGCPRWPPRDWGRSGGTPRESTWSKCARPWRARRPRKTSVSSVSHLPTNLLNQPDVSLYRASTGSCRKTPYPRFLDLLELWWNEKQNMSIRSLMLDDLLFKDTLMVTKRTL